MKETNKQKRCHCCRSPNSGLEALSLNVYSLSVICCAHFQASQIEQEGPVHISQSEPLLKAWHAWPVPPCSSLVWINSARCFRVVLLCRVASINNFIRVSSLVHVLHVIIGFNVNNITFTVLDSIQNIDCVECEFLLFAPLLFFQCLLWL